MTEKELGDEKEIAWYAAALDAWYGTRLEHDKSLLTLSAGGIGLLITLASTVGIPSRIALRLASLAILAFILCVVAVLLIFKGNSGHLEDVVHGEGNAVENSLSWTGSRSARSSPVLYFHALWAS